MDSMESAQILNDKGLQYSPSVSEQGSIVPRPRKQRGSRKNRPYGIGVEHQRAEANYNLVTRNGELLKHKALMNIYQVLSFHAYRTGFPMGSLSHRVYISGITGKKQNRDTARSLDCQLVELNPFWRTANQLLWEIDDNSYSLPNRQKPYCGMLSIPPKGDVVPDAFYPGGGIVPDVLLFTPVREDVPLFSPVERVVPPLSPAERERDVSDVPPFSPVEEERRPEDWGAWLMQQCPG